MSNAAFDPVRASPTVMLDRFDAFAVARRLTASPALRFIVAGGFSSLINWIVRFPLSWVLPFSIAVGVAYAVGMVVGFQIYRIWVFPGSTLRLGNQILRFIMVNLGGFSVVVLGSHLLVLMIGATHLLSPAGGEAVAHAMGIACGAVVNFLGHRAVTFAKRIAGRST